LSAVLQLPLIWATQSRTQTGPRAGSSPLQPKLLASAASRIQKRLSKVEDSPAVEPEAEPVVTYAFYRKHTENLLRRYLYASMQVGRSPNLLAESVGRGWASSRRVRTFEDALIFVLDVERCLNRLSAIDRQLISRILIQEYTQTETAALLGVSLRTVCTKLPLAIDHLTESLVKADLLVLGD
jgi:DNA-directed RNA polymerase specialized sigma24 family protein